jgi:hypothetical protein
MPDAVAAAEGADFPAASRAFAEAAERALAGGGADVADADLQRALSCAVRLYAVKAERENAFPPPVAPEGVTPTEVVLVVSEMLRAVDVSLFDLAMWYRRGRP